mgnify:CR=1 FL=1
MLGVAPQAQIAREVHARREHTLQLTLQPRELGAQLCHLVTAERGEPSDATLERCSGLNGGHRRDVQNHLTSSLALLPATPLHHQGKTALDGVGS